MILKALLQLQKSADRSVNRKDAPEGVVNEFRKFSAELSALYAKAVVTHAAAK